MFVIYKNIGEAKLKQQDLKAAYLYWGYALAYVDDKELEQKRINPRKIYKSCSHTYLQQFFCPQKANSSGKDNKKSG